MPPEFENVSQNDERSDNCSSGTKKKQPSENLAHYNFFCFILKCKSVLGSFSETNEIFVDQIITDQKLLKNVI